MITFDKIIRKLTKFRLRPIHVYCLHHVCETFYAENMYECDWMEINNFKLRLQFLRKEGVHFISLTEAHKKISKDIIRFKKYAVITFDDGYSSLREILPWLKEQSIPVTLFINTDYLNGKAYRETDKECYITYQEISKLDVEIGMHGTQHIDVSRMSNGDFRAFAERTIEETFLIKGFIPFWAYAWGRHSKMTDDYLLEKNIIPIYMDGVMNYNDSRCIHRELFD